MFPLTNVLTEMLNFKNIPRYHLLFLLLVVLFSARATAADTLLILGDSLSAGYHLPVEQSWPVLMDKKWQKSGNKITVINGSISGNTAAQGLERLPELLKQHKPRWVLIELGANDGLRGFPPQQTEQDLQQIITLVKQANIQAFIDADPVCHQTMGDVIPESFAGIYPKLAEHNQIPLLPFYMEQVAIKPEWVQQDGLHPNLLLNRYRRLDI
uniref:YcaA n=1 Tax=Photorhabdus luminescens TaxID=29488 RepID=Q9AI01_PHOLU|nr:YcaA [Photorhabdus luminescens]